jgi:hypothetical protein
MKTQFRKSLLASALAVSFAGGAGSASAALNETLYFGTLLSGSYQPSDTFASMSVISTDDLTFTFALNAYDLNSLFTSGAYIDKAIFNTVTGDSPTSLAFLSGDVSGVTLANGPNVGSVTFDFGANFPNNNNGGARLTANETASWSVTFASAQTSLFADPSSALHVASLTTGQGGSAWYTPTTTPTTPVPEPETYAMLLAGLGLIGAIARRRRAQ